MRNFAFVIPERLAGMAYPGDFQDLEKIKQMGFKSIVSLSERIPEQELLTSFNHLHHPLPDFTHIPGADIHIVVTFIETADFPLVVHCEGGIGRTGVVLACVFVNMGYSAKDAIAKVREYRPGSIDDIALEESVEHYQNFIATLEKGQ